MALKLTPTQKLLSEVAQGGTFDTEYDGRTYTHCKFCEVDLNEGDCEDDCLSLVAQELLGDKWLEIERERLGLNRQTESERIAAEKYERKRIERQNERNAPVECPDCGRTVAKQGLVSHQRTQRCHKRALRIKELAVKTA
jgi:hypothetical protein